MVLYIIIILFHPYTSSDSILIPAVIPPLYQQWLHPYTSSDSTLIPAVTQSSYQQWLHPYTSSNSTLIPAVTQPLYMYKQWFKLVNEMFTFPFVFGLTFGFSAWTRITVSFWSCFAPSVCLRALSHSHEGTFSNLCPPMTHTVRLLFRWWLQLKFVHLYIFQELPNNVRETQWLFHI